MDSSEDLPVTNVAIEPAFVSQRTAPVRPRARMSDRQLLKYGMAGGLGLLVTLIVIANVFWTDSARMDRAIEHHDEPAILQYVDSHIGNTDNDEVVIKCLKSALATKMPTVVAAFEKIALSANTNTDNRLTVFRQFSASKQPFSNVDALTSIVSDSTDASIVEAARNVLLLSPLFDRKQAINNELQTAIGAGASPDWNGVNVSRVLAIGTSVLPEMRQQIALVDSLEQNALTAQHTSADFQGKIAEAQSNLNDARIDASKPPMMLNAFMIAQNKPNLYEIALGLGGPHAVLITTTTSFQTRGTFDLTVKDIGTMPEDIKEEYGGFTQMWHWYEECNALCVQGYNSARAKVEELTTNLAKLHLEQEAAVQKEDDVNQQFIHAARGLLDSTKGEDVKLDANTILNRTYVLGPDKRILTDGKWSEDRETVDLIASTITFGDLRSEKDADAVAILGESGGGSGYFENLVAIANDHGRIWNSSEYPLGDRVRINSIKIEAGVVTVDMLTQGPNDGLCCPTVDAIVRLKLIGRKLVLIN